MQPAYLVYLAASIKRDYERQTLLAAVKQVMCGVVVRNSLLFLFVSRILIMLFFSIINAYQVFTGLEKRSINL